MPSLHKAYARSYRTHRDARQGKNNRSAPDTVRADRSKPKTAEIDRSGGVRPLVRTLAQPVVEDYDQFPDLEL